MARSARENRKVAGGAQPLDFNPTVAKKGEVRAVGLGQLGRGRVRNGLGRESFGPNTVLELSFDFLIN